MFLLYMYEDLKGQAEQSSDEYMSISDTSCMRASAR
jgi:hypothetical protein